MDERIIKIQHVLKKELDDNRYQHTLGVMYTAASMAMRYDVDVLKALYAGLLHDCAKCIPNDKKLHLCRKYGFTVSDIERENPSLLHAKLGACLAHEKYGVTDKEIIHAIESHTTGCPAMTMLEKIIYIADYIEPNREKFDGLEEARRLAYLDLDMAMKYILESTIAFVKERGRLLHPLSLEALEYYKHCVEKEETE